MHQHGGISKISIKTNVTTSVKAVQNQYKNWYKSI